MVSDPENIVIRLPVVVERTSKRTCAGQGRYSYCHPARGFRPSWLAAIRVDHTNCGIFHLLDRDQSPLPRSVQFGYRAAVFRAASTHGVAVARIARPLVWTDRAEVDVDVAVARNI